MKVRILVVSLHDDNFGDNLIRICFISLLKVVLQNLGVHDYSIVNMHLKRIDGDIVKNSTIIFFSGGAIIGHNYLHSYQFVDQITRLAEDANIPVIFSSVGINNKDATAQSDREVTDMLSRACVKAISVRDTPAVFNKYAENQDFDVEVVADPACWVRYVYNIIPKSSDIVGINVVRGGLFQSNGRSWQLADQIGYLLKLKALLDDAGIDYRFYTNGSFNDDNALLYFATENNIPEEKFILVNTSKQLVEVIASFGACAAVRMHSSIVAYSLGVPSTSLVWNDKIPFFYHYIGHDDRALSEKDWDVNKVFSSMQRFLAYPPETVDSTYLMSLYRFIFRVASDYLVESTEDMFDFDKVTEILAQQASYIDEDINDLRIKLRRGQKKYLAGYRLVTSIQSNIAYKIAKKLRLIDLVLKLRKLQRRKRSSAKNQQ